MPERGPLMFHRLAAHYDDLVGEKDYRSEVEQLTRLVRRYGPPRARSWLDVACGTGRHLELLRRRFRVAGVDRSASMLRVARRRLPGVRLVRADMRTFSLGATYDVITCLYSSIGHLRSERQVAAAFANFARHLKPGGVMIVEPWIAPDQFHAGFLHLLAQRTPSGAVARMAYSTRRGSRSLVQYHYLLGETGRGVRHLEETDVGLLVAPARLVALLRTTGLTARFLRRGLPTGRGLLLGVRRR